MVAVDVEVSVGNAVGVELGMDVSVGVEVKVGPKTWPGPQADRENVRQIAYRMVRLIFISSSF
jgi:hypothetical protein